MQVLASTMGALGTLVVGLVFFLSGLVKAVDLEHFVRHLSRLRLFPHKTLVPLAVLLVALECVLGTALMVSLWLEWLIPSASVVLMGAAVVTWWSVATGRVEDCGCYGGLIAISPRASVLLDLVYLGLLWSAWASSGPMPHAPVQIALVPAAAALSVLLAVASRIHTVKTGRPLLHTGPLKVGRRWRSTWLPASWSEEALHGSKIIVFLSPACTLCKRWVRVFNMANRLEGLPSVIGVVAVAPERVEQLQASVAAWFPFVAIEPWSHKRLTRGELPTAVLVVDKTIRGLWVRSLPAELGEDIRRRLLATGGADAGASPNQRALTTPAGIP